MRILHSSDLHGTYKPLLKELAKPDYDIWVDTGDFFPNKTRGIVPDEIRHQSRWVGYKRLGHRIAEALDGRPLVCVGGNHCYVDLAWFVRKAGGAAFNIGDGQVEVSGVRFAGFREIPWIAGEWNGETHDLTPMIEKTFATFDGEGPDVLLTHAPPGGVLDDENYGIAPLMSHLMYHPHRVHTHLFGHAHVNGDKTEEAGGITFHNAAQAIGLVQF